MKVCIGGTFDELHKGHKFLIDKAFEIAGKKGAVFIGITSDEFIKNKGEIKQLDERIKNLETYLESKGFMKQVIVKSIDDRYGPTLEDDFDFIVVSPETFSNALDINQKRIKKGKKPLEIIKIPFINSEDGKPISSTRIRNKEIDSYGRILRD
jgi:pantetheine-phosphate adenylyltransferase